MAFLDPVQRRNSKTVANARVSSRPKKSLHHELMAMACCEHQGSVAVAILQIDQRPSLDQRTSKYLVAVPTGEHQQGAAAIWVCWATMYRIHVPALIQPLLHSCNVSSVSCGSNVGRKSAWIRPTWCLALALFALALAFAAFGHRCNLLQESDARRPTNRAEYRR